MGTNLSATRWGHRTPWLLKWFLFAGLRPAGPEEVGRGQAEGPAQGCAPDGGRHWGSRAWPNPAKGQGLGGLSRSSRSSGWDTGLRGPEVGLHELARPLWLPLRGAGGHLEGGRHEVGGHLGPFLPGRRAWLTSSGWDIMSLPEVVTEQVISATGGIQGRGRPVTFLQELLQGDHLAAG